MHKPIPPFKPSMGLSAHATQQTHELPEVKLVQSHSKLFIESAAKNLPTCRKARDVSDELFVGVYTLDREQEIKHAVKHFFRATITREEHLTEEGYEVPVAVEAVYWTYSPGYIVPKDVQCVIGTIWFESLKGSTHLPREGVGIDVVD